MVGQAMVILIGKYQSDDSPFMILYSKVGKGIYFAHPYSAILNSESILENFFIHRSTLRNNDVKRPVIGYNVTNGCHAYIITGVHVGNNVNIGAGTVVV